uniref:Organic solute transporter subunit alpha-like n=1 Tax=Crassostrea virginica TaxID=6565 RepID=A0A8B8ENW1_CRAVI|nr:organic solute transporter subunit alpha-like [Crassostrea virginica]
MVPMQGLPPRPEPEIRHLHPNFVSGHITVLSCGLLIPRSSLIVELIASILRASSLWVIVKIVIGYFGEESKLMAETSDLTFTLQSPPCCCCCVCLKGSPLSSGKLRLVKIFCFQYVVNRPLMVFILILLWTDNRYSDTDEMSPSNPGTYFQILSTISLLFAMWGVIALVRAVDSRLSGNRIRAKFLSVQLMTIFSVAQRALLSFLASRDAIGCVGTHGSMVQAYRYHLVLLVLETFLLSLIARYAFRFQEPPLTYEDTTKKPETKYDNTTFKMDETRCIPLIDELISKSVSSTFFLLLNLFSIIDVQ